MNHVQRWLVWLSRINKCRGFGIQSPTDYAFVRYVVNERWPYYAYESLKDNDWLTQKLGRLYFRIANWRQPKVIECNSYQAYLQAGCRQAVFGDSSELILLTLEGDYRNQLPYIYNKVKDGTVFILDGLWKDKGLWRELVADERTSITFDLYYCGIVLFDKKRHKQNYIINF